MKFNISPVEMINSDIKIKIIMHLMMHESVMSEREIASVLKVSHTSVNRILKELANYNIVKYSTVGKNHQWEINNKSYGLEILSGIIKNISSLESPLENLKKTISYFLPEKLIKRVVLFGSVAKGSEELDSDIDLFILVRNDKDKIKIQNTVDNLSNECLDKYGNRLAAYILTEDKLKQNKKLKITQELEKGIQIYGTKM